MNQHQWQKIKKEARPFPLWPLCLLVVLLFSLVVLVFKEEKPLANKAKLYFSETSAWLPQEQNLAWMDVAKFFPKNEYQPDGWRIFSQNKKRFIAVKEVNGFIFLKTAWQTEPVILSNKIKIPFCQHRGKIQYLIFSSARENLFVATVTEKN
jgi:hypothetical protein